MLTAHFQFYDFSVKSIHWRTLTTLFSRVLAKKKKHFCNCSLKFRETNSFSNLVLFSRNIIQVRVKFTFSRPLWWFVFQVGFIKGFKIYLFWRWVLTEKLNDPLNCVLSSVIEPMKWRQKVSQSFLIHCIFKVCCCPFYLLFCWMSNEMCGVRD